MEQENKKSEEFYKRFKEKLDNEDFPGNYTFKFIVPSDNQKIAMIQQLFDGARPQFSMKASRNGKYTSVTAVIFAMDSESIINYYKSAAKIEEIIML